MIPQVAASERGSAQTEGVPALSGLRDGRGQEEGERNGMERPSAEGERPVREADRSESASRVARDTRNPV